MDGAFNLPYMTIEDWKDIAPYVIGILTTIIALKKDWIASKFEKAKHEIAVGGEVQDLESKQLGNVEKEIEIYRGLLDDLSTRHKVTMDEIQVTFDQQVFKLREEIQELRDLIESQKKYITNSNRRLKSYIDKYGEHI